MGKSNQGEKSHPVIYTVESDSDDEASIASLDTAALSDLFVKDDRKRHRDEYYLPAGSKVQKIEHILKMEPAKSAAGQESRAHLLNHLISQPPSPERQRHITEFFVKKQEERVREDPHAREPLVRGL